MRSQRDKWNERVRQTNSIMRAPKTCAVLRVRAAEMAGRGKRHAEVVSRLLSLGPLVTRKCKRQQRMKMRGGKMERSFANLAESKKSLGCQPATCLRAMMCLPFAPSLTAGSDLHVGSNVWDPTFRPSHTALCGEPVRKEPDHRSGSPVSSFTRPETAGVFWPFHRLR